jgi:hypothetical protein
MRHWAGIVAGGLAAVLTVTGALAGTLETSWSKAGAPVDATGAFVQPPPGTKLSPDAFKALALYEGDHSGGGIFDEVRFGAMGFWQDNSDSVQGVYFAGQVLFDPFVRPFDNRILNVLLRPRPHIGATVSPDGPDQLFGGVTWTIPVWRNLFVETSFGGTIHNAPLKNAQVAVGCRVLFRESLGLGLDFGQHWRVVAGVDHSSHANLCGNDNDGLTHLGASIGYRF